MEFEIKKNIEWTKGEELFGYLTKMRDLSRKQIQIIDRKRAV